MDLVEHWPPVLSKLYVNIINEICKTHINNLKINMNIHIAWFKMLTFDTASRIFHLTNRLMEDHGH